MASRRARRACRPAGARRAAYGVGGLLDRLVGIFGRGNVYVELQRHLLRDEEADNAALTELAQAFRVPVIATNGVRFAEPSDRPLFDVLTCVHHARRSMPPAGCWRATPSGI